jgi:hypothetical protein
VHCDLKASNVLIWPFEWREGGAPGDDYDPTYSDDFAPTVADFEWGCGDWVLESP